MTEGDAHMTSSARDVACRHLLDAARAHPSIFPRAISSEPLDPRDRRLAEAIVNETMARWLTISTLADCALRTPWPRLEPLVQAALLSGGAQLLFLDRVPDHAVVGETVEWVKRSGGRRGTAGLVNAVLRKIIELRGDPVEHADGTARDQLLRSNGGGWQLTQDVFDDDPLQRMAQQTGHSPILLERWQQAMGRDEAFRIALHGLCTPPVVLHGAGRDDSLLPHDAPGFSVLASDASLEEVLARHPDAIVQDATTARAIPVADGLSPKVILDLCAGHGTKSLQLARRHPDSRVIVSDTDDRRLQDLQDLSERVENIEVMDASAARGLRGEVDLLVLDVPCSNTGVLPRRREARIRFNEGLLKDLVDLQHQIAADAIATLATNAHILYITCSLETQENEAMPRWLTKWHGHEVVHEASSLPGGLPGDPPSSYRDGGYVALLRT